MSNFIHSLRFKLIVFSILIEIIMLSLLIFNANRLISSNLTSETYKQIEIIKSNFQASILPLLIERDYASLDALLLEYTNSKNIVYIFILNNQKILSSSNWMSEKEIPIQDKNIETSKKIFNSKIDIKYSGQIYGTVYFGLNTEFLEKAQEELLQQKRELIVSQCISVSEMLGLKMPLTAKQFAYLKDYDLSKITDEITRAGKEQAEKERIAIEKIQKEADEKARIEAEKKILEESKVEEVKESINNQSEPQKEVLTTTLVQETIQEVKTTQKLFYGVLEFEGITISEATAFRKFLDENNIKFKTIKSEVK